MMTNDAAAVVTSVPSNVSRPRALETILLGGLAIGVLDFLDATLFFMLYSGASFQRIWQGVSSGLLGIEAARAGGWNTALLGIFLHFAVSFCIATVYYLAASNISFLIRRPVVSGLIFGVLAHLGMKYVVIPLSAIGTIAPYNLPNFLNSVIGHAVLVGLPVALIASWSAKKSRTES